MSAHLTEYHLLSGLPGPWLEQLVDTAERRTFDAGERIFTENERADRFWLLDTGRVGLDLAVPGHGDVLIETIGPGEVLGWSWLFPPYRWHFSAAAVEPTEAREFPADPVRALCEQDPAMGMELMRRFTAIIVDRLQATRMRLLDMYGNRP